MAGSLLGLPEAFLVAFISAPKADATSFAAFNNICCSKKGRKTNKQISKGIAGPVIEKTNYMHSLVFSGVSWSCENYCWFAFVL